MRAYISTYNPPYKLATHTTAFTNNLDSCASLYLSLYPAYNLATAFMNELDSDVSLYLSLWSTL